MPYSITSMVSDTIDLVCTGCPNKFGKVAHSLLFRTKLYFGQMAFKSKTSTKNTKERITVVNFHFIKTAFRTK